MIFKDIVTYIEIYMPHKCHYINVCGYIHEKHMIIFHAFCIHFFFIYLVSENTFLTFKDLKSLLGETGVTTVDVMGSLL